MNIFVNLPVLAANGPGAAVDVSAMGKTKSIVCGGAFSATINVEYATDELGTVWAPLATFQQSGNLTIDVAARWLRTVTSNYNGGAANVDVGSSDAGSLFVVLPANGSSVDISALPLFKTVVAAPGFAGNIQVSEDGVSWAQIFSFQNGGGTSRPVYGQFARIGNGSGGDVSMGAANEAGGEEAFALLHYNWEANNIASQKNISGVADIVAVGIRDFKFDVPIDEDSRAVITVGLQPVTHDDEVFSINPVNCYGQILVVDDVQVLRVTVYETQALNFGLANPTDDVIKVYIRVDRVA